MIELKIKITLQDYRRLNFLLVYRRPMTVILSFIGIINIIAFLIYLCSNFGNFLTNPIFNLVFGIGLTIVTPASIYYSSKKIFNTNKYLQEESIWTISEEKVKIKGKSFESEYNWSNVYKIKKIKNWTIIYQDRIIANFIPMKSFKTHEDIELFWEYVRRNNVRLK